MSTEQKDINQQGGTQQTAKAQPARRLGFDEKGKPYRGVDPKTGERMAVVLTELQAEFGAREGLAKYIAIANLEGEHIHPETREPYMWRYFHDPRSEGAGYHPDLVVAILPEAAREQVKNILTTPQAQED